MLELLVELRRAVEAVNLAVDLDPEEPPTGELDEELAELALAVGDERGEEHHLGPLRLQQEVGDDLLGGLGLHRLAADVTVLDADPGVEHPEVVVDLRDRADRRSRVVRRALLLDGDGRREAPEMLDLGSL